MRIDSTVSGLTPVPRPAPIRAARELGADLRAQLSPEELTYFAELEKLGDVTYSRRPGSGNEAPPPKLGQRVDVRA
jgi:hypothetical protein